MERIKYSFKYTQNFYREYKRIAKKDRGLVLSVEVTLKKLSVDPFSKSLRTHYVQVPFLHKVFNSRVNGDIRILWVIDAEGTIILQRIGSHSGSSKVYR